MLAYSSFGRYFSLIRRISSCSGAEYVYSKDNSKPKTDKENGAFFLKDQETATFLNKFTESSKVYVTEEKDGRFITSWRWDKTANNYQGDTSGEGYKTSDVIIPKNQKSFEK